MYTCMISNFIPKKMGLYKISEFIEGDIVYSVSINNQEWPFSQTGKSILFLYKGQLNSSLQCFIKTEKDESAQELKITFFENSGIAQKTPDGIQSIEDYLPFLGLVRIASNEETDIATLGNENGAVVTPKQVYDITTKANFLRKWNDDKPSGELQEAPQEGDLSYRNCNNQYLWCIYTEGQWEPLSKQKGDKGDKGDPGKDGKDGVDGQDGQNGKDGVNGKDGSIFMINNQQVNLSFSIVQNEQQENILLISTNQVK